MVAKAVLFPGQGAQYVGMGRDLYGAYPVFRDIFNQASKVLGMDLPKLCFEGPSEELTRTRNCQPAILTVSYAVYHVLRSEMAQLDMDGFAGLSLGEFTALIAAGSLSFEDALRTVQARAQYMDEACLEKKGTMASILGLELNQAEEACTRASDQGVVTIANVNSQSQIVVSGDLAGVTGACEEAKKLGAKRAIVLDVSGAFHSPLMESARQKLSSFLSYVSIKEPKGVFICNVKGQCVSNPDDIRKFLVEQVTGSVLWEPSMREFIRQGFGLFIEAGCGRVLSGLMKKIQPDVTMLHVEDLKSLENIKQSLG